MTDPNPSSLGPLDQAHGDVVPEYQAKQGRRGLHIFAVLAVSLVLGVLAVSSLGVFHAHQATDTGSAAAAARTATASAGS